MGIRQAFRHKSTSEKVCDPEKGSMTSSMTDTPPKVAVPVSIPVDKDSDFGTNPIIKTLYENAKKGWTESPPKQISPKTVKTFDRVAIKVYKVVDISKPAINGRSVLKTQTIEIQSPALVAALKPLLQPYGTFLAVHETASFREPFKPLFFAYDDILELRNNPNKDASFAEHLRLLLQLLKDEFGTVSTRLQHLHESELICHDLAWTYFPKGTIVYHGAKDSERLYRVIDTGYDCHKKLVMINCQYMEFNGSKFAWSTASLDLPSFAGNVPINSLPSYPLSYHVNRQNVEAKMLSRGKAVLEYQDLQYRKYHGTGKSDDAHRKRHNVSGRILIDHHGHEKYHKGLTRKDDDVKEGESSYIERLSEQQKDKNKARMLNTPQNLILLSPMLAGFALKEKQWLHFYVDDIRPVNWNDEAYSHLVYPKEQKDLVLTFVSHHKHMKEGLTDVVAGKGQGLVTLLSGPPGTGKTLLAEAVADKTRRPLYYLQAEELGTSAPTLGANIKRVFSMATEWNAIILLDEADVFMAERSPSDVLRNELVSIFLRELEYYQGIIFLTTNLLSTIDNAFRSRVNIHLIFNPLGVEARKQLWEKLLSRLPEGSEGNAKSDFELLSEGDIDELAKWDLNGREIKNAIKTVRTWCVCKHQIISLERLESGIAVTAPQAKKGGLEEVE